MKTNISITLTDAERSHLANLLDGTVSKRLATRAEVKALAGACFASALSLNIGDLEPGTGDGVTATAGAVIEDINRGGWSLIGEPPGA